MPASCHAFRLGDCPLGASRLQAPQDGREDDDRPHRDFRRRRPVCNWPATGWPRPKSSEPNDPNAIALATVDAEGLPNVRMVLLKEIEADAFVFYTNYESAKAAELAGRQGRLRDALEIAAPPDPGARAGRARGRAAGGCLLRRSRSLQSRLGAWASRQSQPLSSRQKLMADVARITLEKGIDPPRPPFWGGYRLTPVEIEFWADGAHRLHDRFQWRRDRPGAPWRVERLCP
jgi:pyridoxamine 5'-phosphate oxidase